VMYKNRDLLYGVIRGQHAEVAHSAAAEIFRSQARVGASFAP